MVNQTNQLDSGPELNRNVLVQPRLEAKLHAANAYPEKTAGPIRAATRAPNSWAVSVAQTPARAKKVPLACKAAAAREDSDRMAIAVVRVSGIFSAFTDSDARHVPKVPEAGTNTFQ